MGRYLQAEGVVKTSIVDTIRDYFWPLRRLKDLWYNFKCWAWTRFSTVKPRTLGHTWCDRRELLAHMMFEILSQFIEKECSPGIVAWHGHDGKSGHMIVVDGVEKNVRDEMQDLYDWWHQQYLKRYPAIEENLWAAQAAHSKAHQIGNGRKEGELWYWEPKFDTPENAERGIELVMRINYLEYAANNALTKRLIRMLAIRDYMWT